MGGQKLVSDETLFLVYDYLCSSDRWAISPDSLEVLKSYGIKNWSIVSLAYDQLDDEGIEIIRGSTKTTDISRLSPPKQTLYKFLKKGSR